MFTIGDFAKHGRVSVRMLRHYDAIGLLRPAHVDPRTGYRFYAARQLARLNRVITLKELGFTLEQVGAILDERVDAHELRGMLRLRRAELAASMAAEAARLAQVEARLRLIESEGHMPAQDVVVKPLPATRVAELTAMAPGFDPRHIGPVIRPLYAELCRRLDTAGIAFGPGLAYYEPAPDGGDSVVVHARMVVGPEVTGNADFAVVDLPAVEEAAAIVHHGSMDAVLSTVQVLAHWLDANNRLTVGYTRELYLECPDDQDKWVTELQQPLARPDAGADTRD
ncbi:MerR family transcriptional regulator [Yinghuangia sp. YIM S09857]|uniref:MerR family transcriptional regulator n=1 Tax=Yinghuangia sp. YIM S09857 TaxID=3436929 RepID=UPI003F5362C8